MGLFDKFKKSKKDSNKKETSSNFQKIDLSNTDNKQCPNLSIEEIDKITDENTLKDIVINESNNLNVRLAALKKINSDTILKNIYFNVSGLDIQKECLNRISNDEILIDAINNKYHIDFLVIVFNKLQPENVIKLLKSFNFTISDDNVQEVFKEQINNITDEKTLNDIARNAANSSIRGMAVEKVTDQKTLIYIAKNNDEDFHIRNKAIEKITDNNVLKDIYNTADLYFCREAALKSITDQDFLYSVFKDADWDLRRELIDNITDEAIMSKIVKDETDPFVVEHIALNSSEESTLTYIKDNSYSINGTKYSKPNDVAKRRLKEFGYE